MPIKEDQEKQKTPVKSKFQKVGEAQPVRRLRIDAKILRLARFHFCFWGSWALRPSESPEGLCLAV
jgi:hypothetical protein